MSIVTITLGNKKFQLSCSEENKPALERLAEYLDKEFQNVKSKSPSASFELALVITALGLIDNKTKESSPNQNANQESELRNTLLDIDTELKNVAKKLKI